MEERTINGLPYKDWLGMQEKGEGYKSLSEQKKELYEEIKKEKVSKYMDTTRINKEVEDLKRVVKPKTIRGKAVRNRVSIVLESDSYDRDLIVMYYPETKEMSIKIKDGGKYLTHKEDKNGEKVYMLPKGQRKAYIILAESFLDKGSRGNKVRLIDEKGSNTDLDNIEWFEAEGNETKPSINVKEELKSIKSKGLRMLQVEDYILIEDGRVITNKKGVYLTVSSTRKDYTLSLSYGAYRIIAETVVKLTLEESWKTWGHYTEEEKIDKITNRETKGDKKYTEKFHEDVIEDLGKVSKSDKIRKEESLKRRANREIEKERKGKTPLEIVLSRIGNAKNIIITEDKKYVLLPTGLAVSVTRGKPLSIQGDKNDPAYLIYINKKQKVIHARSIVNYIKVLVENKEDNKGVVRTKDGKIVISSEELLKLTGKRSKYYAIK